MAAKGSLPPRPEVRTLLLDLDGTLVRMRRTGMELRFMVRAALRFARVIPPWRYRRGFWAAAEQMQRHGSGRINYEVFLETLGREASCTRDELDAIVRACLTEDFGRLSGHFSPVPGARETIVLARELGYRVVVATNPVWPLMAVRMRLAWGGLDDVPFDAITHSESMTCCKPSPGYYRELLAQLEVEGGACLMVGNDARKDLPAKELGCHTWLIELPETRGAIAAAQGDPRLDAWGNYEDLQGWLRRSAEER